MRSGERLLSALAAVSSLSGRLGYEFREPELLLLALTHRSWCAENNGEPSNERLEFLGDAVLGLVVTDHTFRRYPEFSEGQLAKLRASVVSAVTLADLASNLDLGAALRLGKGEESSGGRDKSSILSDAMEAVIGAVYVDGGWAAAEKLVLGLVENHITAAALGPGVHDHKTRLQELAAALLDDVPVYQVTESGPDHDKAFFAAVAIAGRALGRGEGRTKKQAEQAAAQVAWAELDSLRAASIHPSNDNPTTDNHPSNDNPTTDNHPSNDNPTTDKGRP